MGTLDNEKLEGLTEENEGTDICLEWDKLTDEQKKLIDKRIELRKCFGEAYIVSSKIFKFVSKYYIYAMLCMSVILLINSIASRTLLNKVNAACAIVCAMLLGLRYGSMIVKGICYMVYNEIKIYKL